MMNDTNIWLERLASIHKSQMRKAAAEAGVQLVHLEILQYLWICNRYSNTAQALSEYLGQTKGSISQSLKIIEESGHVERRPCEKDGRKQRIHLTAEGKAFLRKISRSLIPKFADRSDRVEQLKELLMEWQQLNDLHSFGQCKSCQYNESLASGKFRCGLTGEALSKSDTTKICREHDFQADAGEDEAETSSPKG